MGPRSSKYVQYNWMEDKNPEANTAGRDETTTQPADGLARRPSLFKLHAEVT
jgi:hypothetical protein